jgi:hypothetical protein
LQKLVVARADSKADHSFVTVLIPACHAPRLISHAKRGKARLLQEPKGDARMLSKMAKAGLVVALVGLAGCSGLSTKEQRMLSGGAIGAGVGAAGTALTGGCVTCGALIGGAVGTGAGYLYDEGKSD